MREHIIMNIDFIKKHKQKTITLEEIKKNVKFCTQKELYTIIQEYIDKNILSPIKNSGYSYEQPFVYKKYRIIKDDYSEILEEISEIKILDMKYYRNHPDEFQKDKEKILKINNYFYTKPQNDMVLSINERSLEIFNDEKFLASDDCSKLLTKLKLKVEDFNIYKTPEIFMYYRNKNISSNKILIVENKDTFTTIKKALISGNKILGHVFDAVIYGEGRKIISSFNFISDEEFADFNSKNNIFMYFGDIDASGINIFYSLKKIYSDYKIVAFNEAYEYLLSQKEKYSHIKLHDDETVKKDIKITFEQISNCILWDKKLNDEILIFCNENKIIPQEVLNNRVLRERG